jgi:hypothetical protein
MISLAECLESAQHTDREVEPVTDIDKPSVAHGTQSLTTEMDVLSAIRNRRSIRRYTGDPINASQLDTLLEAGFCAPSASNRRPWHFVVIREATRLQEIAAAHPYAKMMPSAGCCIVVCGDRALQPAPGLLVEDCSAAIRAGCSLVRHLRRGGRQARPVCPPALAAGGSACRRHDCRRTSG